MRDYGKVYSTFWSSETTGGLSDDAKILALYLMTCSHSTIAGVFRLPDGYVSEDLGPGWDTERVAKGFDELLRKGFANRCETTKWVWVRKHLEWNKPENPNQRKAAAKVAQGIPDGCAWKLDFMRVSAVPLGIEWTEPPNPSGTLSEPFLNQKQEQEQKQDLLPPSATGKTEPAANAGLPVDPKGTRLPSDWSLPADWSAWCEEHRPDLDPQLVAEGFKDFWIGKPGKDGRKADWLATWRNWCRGQKPGTRQACAARQETFV